MGKPVDPGVTRDILQCAERVLQLLGSNVACLLFLYENVKKAHLSLV